MSTLVSKVTPNLFTATPDVQPFREVAREQRRPRFKRHVEKERVEAPRLDAAPAPLPVLTAIVHRAARPIAGQKQCCLFCGCPIVDDDCYWQEGTLVGEVKTLDGVPVTKPTFYAILRERRTHEASCQLDDYPADL